MGTRPKSDTFLHVCCVIARCNPHLCGRVSRGCPWSLYIWPFLARSWNWKQRESRSRPADGPTGRFWIRPHMFIRETSFSEFLLQKQMWIRICLRVSTRGGPATIPAPVADPYKLNWTRHQRGPPAATSGPDHMRNRQQLCRRRPVD